METRLFFELPTFSLYLIKTIRSIYYCNSQMLPDILLRDQNIEPFNCLLEVLDPTFLCCYTTCLKYPDGLPQNHGCLIARVVLNDQLMNIQKCYHLYDI